MNRCFMVLLILSFSMPVDAADSSKEQGAQDRTIAALKDVSIEPVRRMRGTGAKWDHRIQIALPPSYGKANKAYPVLWVTDGPAYFEIAVKTVNSDLRAHIPEIIVVAVGVPPEALDEFGRRRAYEFSTTGLSFTGFGAELMDEHIAAGRKQRQAAGEPDIVTGGAAPFLKFLVDEVRPALAKDYRMADEHVLFGDSGGGFFCTFALLARPQAFTKYICGSPNLYAGDHDLFRMEERYAKAHDDLKAAVFFGAGEAEMLEPNIIPAWGIVSSMARMAEILSLRKYPSLELHARIFPGEDHGSVIPLNLSWGLRTLLKKEVPEKK